MVPRYIVFANPGQFWMADTITEAFELYEQFGRAAGGRVYEPLAMSAAEKVDAEWELLDACKRLKRYEIALVRTSLPEADVDAFAHAWLDMEKAIAREEARRCSQS